MYVVVVLVRHEGDGEGDADPWRQPRQQLTAALLDGEV